MNIRSWLGKADLLLLELKVKCIDICCLTETHVDNSIFSGELCPPGWSVYRKDRTRYGGGVAIITRDECGLVCSEASDGQYDDIEHVAIQLCHKGLPSRVTLVNVYKPPTFSEDVRLCDMITSYSRLAGNSGHLLVVGDFNYPEICWDESASPSSSRARLFLECLLEVGLEQLVLTSTHAAGNTLDLLLSSHRDEIVNVSVLPGLSDHHAIGFCLQLPGYKPPHQNYCKDFYFLYDQADFGAASPMFEETSQLVSQCIASGASVDSVWQVFKGNLLAIEDKVVPKKYLRRKSARDPAWMDRTLKNHLSKQRRLYNKCKTDRSLTDKYVSMRKMTKVLIRQAKSSFMFHTLYDKLEEGNTTPFFKYLKGKAKPKSSIPSLTSLDGATCITNVTEKCQLFSDYFQSVFIVDNGVMPISSPRVCRMQEDLIVTQMGVMKLLSTLNKNKSSGPDKISCHMLKSFAQPIAPILTEIFNYSLNSGCVPCDWKMAFVVPVHKKGSKGVVGNYRPISLTSVCCKILEHIVHSTISSWLESQDILHVSQHGFRKHRSCVTQLVNIFHDFATGKEHRQTLDAIFLDFRKAFDTVSHSKLLRKLYANGISDSLCTWLASFLSNRSQSVLLEGVVSKPAKVTSGVPQGTVLGPLLFLLFINDLPLVTTATCKLFADDVLLYGQDQAGMQDALNHVVKWAKEWQMELSPGKCVTLRVGSSSSVPVPYMYILNGQPLQWVDHYKYLGVVVQSNLKWDNHVYAQIMKATQMLGLVKRILSEAPTPIRALAYRALVRPHLEYASEVWDPHYNHQVAALEVVQNKALRFVYRIGERDYSMSSLRLEKGWDTLADRRADHRLSLFRKAETGAVALRIPSVFLRQPEMRSGNRYWRPLIRTDPLYHSFWSRTIRDVLGGEK